LQNATWESQEEKNESINQVLTKNNYLQSAYHILLEIEPQEKYYNFIRDMAIRPRRLSVDEYGFEFDGFSGVIADRADPEDFIRALAVQQSDSSAQLFNTVLNRLPGQTSMPDKDNIFDDVIVEIWQHPCPAYLELRKRIKNKALKILKSELTFDLNPSQMPVDTTKKVFRW
jgi:hypothetical protein